MLVVSKCIHERYLLGALLFMLYAASKCTIWSRTYFNFKDKTGQRNYCNVRP